MAQDQQRVRQKVTSARLRHPAGPRRRPASTATPSAPWPALPPWRCSGLWRGFRSPGRRYARCPIAWPVLGGKVLFLGGAATGGRASPQIVSRRRSRKVGRCHKREHTATRAGLWPVSRPYRLVGGGRSLQAEKRCCEPCRQPATTPRRSSLPPYAHGATDPGTSGAWGLPYLGPLPSVTRFLLPCYAPGNLLVTASAQFVFPYNPYGRHVYDGWAQSRPKTKKGSRRTESPSPRGPHPVKKTVRRERRHYAVFRP